MVTLGFVGLGNMGGPMASHLVRTGRDVVGYDRSEEALGRAEEVGVQPASIAADVGAAADVVFLSLPGPDEVEAVVSSLEPELEEGTTVVDTTTSTPETTRRIADRLSERGVAVLGSPVSGGVGGAEDGTLTAMVGGDRRTFEACREYLDAFASDVLHVGEDPGHGHAVKLLNNYLSFTAMVATGEAVVLGGRVGLDLETMCDVFNVSTGRNSATEVKFPNYVAEDRDVGFSLGLMEKDARLLTRFAEEGRTPLLLASVVRNQVGYARNRFGDDGDMTDVYDYLREAMTEPGRPEGG